MMHYGFTLVELMIVLVVIALILSLTLPRFSNDTRNAQAFGLALASYLNDAGSAARSSQVATCVARNAGNYTQTKGGVATGEALPLPNHVTTETHAPICYDAFGRLIGTARVIHIADSAAEAGAGTWTTQVSIGGIYGNARVQR